MGEGGLKGNEVTGLVRNLQRRKLYQHPRLKMIEGDLNHIPTLTAGMRGCRIVFHLAGHVKTWAKNPDVYNKINVEGTVNTFEAALIAGAERVVFTSTAATIPPSRGEIPCSEQSKWEIPMFNLYEKTKLQAEKLAVEYSEKGLPVVTVNPSRVYGPGPMNPSNAVTRMIDGYCHRCWRIIPGDGTCIGNYVYIGDVIRGLMIASEKGKPGERYILGGENLNFDEFFKTLSKITGIRRRMIHLPLPVMLSAAWLMEAQQYLTGIPPLITASWVKKYMNNWSLSSQKAVKDLNYRITPFETGATKTIEWLESGQYFFD